ncbi:MAG TPA: hypothetical protein VGK81_04525, partial [Anaerolineae bacterium]
MTGFALTGCSSATPTSGVASTKGADVPASATSISEPSATQAPTATSTLAATVTPIPATPTAISLPHTNRAVVQLTDNTVTFVDGEGKVTPIGKATDRLASTSFSSAVAGDTVYASSAGLAPGTYAFHDSNAELLGFIGQPVTGLEAWSSPALSDTLLAWGTYTSTGAGGWANIIISRPDGSEARSVVTETQSVMLPSLLPLRWSADGKSLLYSSEPTGIGGYILFDGFSSLYRLDVATGITKTLIPKDNKRLICLDDINQAATSITEHCDEQSIHVLSLTNNVSTTITPPAVVTDAAVLGTAIFNPDGSRIAFAMARNNPDNEQGWLALSNGLSGSSNLIYTSQPGTFASIAGWLDANTIVFQTSSVMGISNTLDTVWAINVDGSNVRQLAQGDILTLEQTEYAPATQPTQTGSLTWRQEAGSCQVAQFDQQSIQYGPCDGTQASASYPEAWDSRAFNHFVQTYKSFSAKTVAGTIVFTGSGTITASPAEQRMVAEFARLAVSKATGGSAVSEDALSWHREGGIVGFCD